MPFPSCVMQYTKMSANRRVNIKRRELLNSMISALGLLAAPLSWSLPARAKPHDVEPLLAIDGLCIGFDIMDDEALSRETLSAVRSSGLTAINMTTPYPGDDFRTAVDKISRLQQIVSEQANHLEIIRSVADIDSCRRNNRLGIIIGFQSTEMFDSSLSAIATFQGLGARVIQMTYNGPGLLGHGCLSESDEGLTETGLRAVGELNQRGLLIDASHANKASTAGTIASSGAPIVISHTACNEIYRHPRNNDDSELRALADGGGVAGIYLMPFLDGGSGELTVEMFFAHLEHALDVCGEDHVGIGSDQGLIAVEDGPEYRSKLKAEVEMRQAAGISAPGESADRPPFIPALNRNDRVQEISRLMRRGDMVTA